jgi:hypothetical protein
MVSDRVFADPKSRRGHDGDLVHQKTGVPSADPPTPAKSLVSFVGAEPQQHYLMDHRKEPFVEKGNLRKDGRDKFNWRR